MNRIDEQKAKNLAAGEGFRLHEIPARRFMDQAQYIESEMIPAAAKKLGMDHASVKYFQEIYQSLLYAIMVKDRENNLLNKCQQFRQENLILSQRNVFLEKELMKYATMEDLFLTEAHSYIENGIAQRARDLLTTKKAV